MKKCRLDLDDVQVESFEMEGEAAALRGTVQARMPTYDPTCTCDPETTCENSGYAYSCRETWCPGSECIIYCGTYETYGCCP